ncbi:DEAD/DEAH box helicase [bacterium]|nr:DEAD/DEAH box helicase [bacterium]
MEIKLRYYQSDSVDAVTEYFKKHPKGNPVIELPTGTGKSYVLAEMIKRYVDQWKARVVVVTHSKKLVQQDYDKTVNLWPEGKNLFGINSAGLKKRSTKAQVIFSGIQSVYKSAAKIGKVNLLICDECHRLNVKDSIQYKGFIEDLLEINPNMRVCGLTATPFRMRTGLIYGPSQDQLFDDLVYRANTKELIAQGYISRPVSPGTGLVQDLDKVRVRADEFVDEDLAPIFQDNELIQRQIAYTLAHAAGRKSIAVFAINIEHAERIAAELRRHGQTAAVVHSKIDEDDDVLIADFEAGKYRFLISVNMFVEGFDSPQIDCIVDIKPTMSPGRYVQMYGRGFRLHPDPAIKDFLVLDFSGNVGRHGPVDQVEAQAVVEQQKNRKAPMKQCERCGEINHARVKQCGYCGWLFPLPEAEDNTSAIAGNLSVISEPQWFDVKTLNCAQSKQDEAIVAHYYCPGKKFTKKVQFDDEGVGWLKDHLGNDIPFDIQNFFNGGFRSKMKIPKKIFVDDAGAASRILEYRF